MFDTLTMDTDADATLPDFADDFLYPTASVDELSELDTLSSTIDDLERLRETTSLYGFTPSLMHFTNHDKLLSSAMPAFVSFESLTTDIAPDTAEGQAAQEAMASKIKDMVAAWFAKAWAAAKAVFDKIGHFAAGIAEHAAKGLIYIKDKTFDAAKATGTYIKAHPIASAFIALAALAAIAAVIVAIWGVPLPLVGGVAAWTQKIHSIINAGLGKFGIKIMDNGAVVQAQEAFFNKKLAKLMDLGYSDSEARKMLDAAATVAAGGDSIAKSAQKAAEHAARLLKEVTDDASNAGEYASKGAAFADILKTKREAIASLLKTTGSLAATFMGQYGKIIIFVLGICLRLYITSKLTRRR